LNGAVPFRNVEIKSWIAGQTTPVTRLSFIDRLEEPHAAAPAAQDQRYRDE
jgi:hypothetical protein